MFGHDQDEVIDLFKNLVALECSPLKQGLLTTSTMVSIVRIEVWIASCKMLSVLFCPYISKLQYKNLVFGATNGSRPTPVTGTQLFYQGSRNKPRRALLALCKGCNRV